MSSYTDRTKNTHNASDGPFRKVVQTPFCHDHSINVGEGCIREPTSFRCTRVVKIDYACGHSKPDCLFAKDNRAMLRTRAFARCTLCPTCQHNAQFRRAYKGSIAVGLSQLQGADISQTELAEIVRWRVWQAVVPDTWHSGRRAFFIPIFQTHLDATFWLEHRAALWDHQAALCTFSDLFLALDDLCVDLSSP